MIEDFLITTICITKPDSSVLDPVPIVSVLSPSRQPKTEGVMRVVIADAPSGGNIKIVGSYDGSPVEEDLVFPDGDHVKVGIELFDAVTEFQVTSISSGTISSNAYRQSGEPIFQEVLGMTIMGRIQRKPEHRAGGQLSAYQGEQQIGAYDLMCMYRNDIIPKYYCYDGQKKYRIDFVPNESRLHNLVCDLVFVENSGYPDV